MGFRAEYEKLAKDNKGNLVKGLASALKNLDAGKGSSKEAALCKTAIAELDKAMHSLQEFEKNAAEKLQKDAAKKLLKGMTSMRRDIEDEASKAEINGKVNAAELAPEDLKDTEAVVKNMAKLSRDVGKALGEFDAERKVLWTTILKFGECRWGAMKDFAKQHGASISGFRSFPMCIPMMVEECSNSKNPSRKVAKGNAQTAGIDPAALKKQQKEEQEEESGIREEFIVFSEKYVSGDLNSVNGGITKLNRALAAIDQKLDATLKSADKLSAEVKGLGVSAKGLQYQKVKVYASALKNQVDKAENAVSALQKIVNKESGLGRQDGDIRDAFNAIPELSAKELESAVDSVESGMKGLSKSA